MTLLNGSLQETVHVWRYHRDIYMENHNLDKGFSHGFPQKAFGWVLSTHFLSLAPWGCSLAELSQCDGDSRKAAPETGAEWTHILDKPHLEMRRVERNNWHLPDAPNISCPEPQPLRPELCLLGREVTQHISMQWCAWRKHLSRTKKPLFTTFSTQRDAKYKSQHQACLKVVVCANSDHRLGQIEYFSATKSKEQEAWLSLLNPNFLRNNQPHILRPGTGQ